MIKPTEKIGSEQYLKYCGKIVQVTLNISWKIRTRSNCKRHQSVRRDMISSASIDFSSLENCRFQSTVGLMERSHVIIPFQPHISTFQQYVKIDGAAFRHNTRNSCERSSCNDIPIFPTVFERYNERHRKHNIRLEW